MRRAVAFTDFQLRLVERAARSLPIEARDAFLKSVADRLSGDPSDAAVNSAINVALDRLPLFVCDSVPKNVSRRRDTLTKEAKP
jgi:hypothetical protein